MTNNETMLNLLAREVVADYIDANGLSKDYLNIDMIDEDKLLEIAIRICERDQDIADMLAEDSFSEVQTAIFGMMLPNLNAANPADRLKTVKDAMLKYYARRTGEMLDAIFIEMYDDMFREVHHRNR